MHFSVQPSTMNPLNDIIANAKAKNGHIVLAEGEDPRIIEAARLATKSGLAKITLLQTTETIDSQSVDNVDVIIPSKSPKLDAYAALYLELRKHKGVDEASARKTVELPLNFANMMVHAGDADGSIAGAVHTTPDVVRSALQIIGVAPDRDMISSFFLMIMDREHHPINGAVLFADSGLVVDPNENELCQIAMETAKSAQILLNGPPRIALLSFATKNSANHPHVDKVANTVRKLSELRPDLAVDGPLQFDAAIVPEIAEKKAPGSTVGGQANIFVFPNLNAGNIGYKIAERIGGAIAIGPILQGLAKPANDLSRGCTATDIYNMIAITALQASVTD